MNAKYEALLALTDPMITTTESIATHQTSSGSDWNFRRIIVRCVLAIAAIAGLVYLSAESPDLDLTRYPKVNDCPIHHMPLVVAKTPITYGEPTDWARLYYHASRVSFPHAGMIVFTSSYDSSEWSHEYRFARVSQCPECVRAEKQWYAGDEKHE